MQTLYADCITPIKYKARILQRKKKLQANIPDEIGTNPWNSKSNSTGHEMDHNDEVRFILNMQGSSVSTDV